MTNFEEILIRLGVDSKAVTTGLQRTGSWIKGWAHDLVNDFRHEALGRFAGLYLVEKAREVFEKIGEKALFLRRLSKETELSTNTLQGFANELGYVGEDFEAINKPLGKFNALIGQAKSGVIAAREKLFAWGVVVKDENYNALTTEKALSKLAAQFDKIEGAERKAALLFTVFGKGYQAIFPIFEMGQKRIEAMNKDNFFTKLSPSTIEMFAQLSRTGKTAWNSAIALGGNLANISLTPLVQAINGLYSGMKFVSDKSKDLIYMFDRSKLELAETKKNVELTNEEFVDQLKLMEQINEQHKLQNQLTDRHKLTVEQLANQARSILGDKRPRGIASMHAITPAMASALQIQNIEDQMQVATARGRFDLADALDSKAKELRSKNLALKSTEQNPMEQVQFKLEQINQTLARLGREGVPVRPADGH